MREATLPRRISFARASSKALCVTLASSRSLKLLPMLGVPSLPSLTRRRWRGDKDDNGTLGPGIRVRRAATGPRKMTNEPSGAGSIAFARLEEFDFVDAEFASYG